MAESHGGGGRLAQSGHVGLVFARGCLRPPFRIGLARVGRLTHFLVGWLGYVMCRWVHHLGWWIACIHICICICIYIWLRYSSPRVHHLYPMVQSLPETPSAQPPPPVHAWSSHTHTWPSRAPPRPSHMPPSTPWACGSHSKEWLTWSWEWLRNFAKWLSTLAKWLSGSQEWLTKS
jgi:hypothetical protein